MFQMHPCEREHTSDNHGALPAHKQFLRPRSSRSTDVDQVHSAGPLRTAFDMV